MNKTVKIILIVVAVLLVLTGIFYMTKKPKVVTPESTNPNAGAGGSGTISDDVALDDDDLAINDVA